MWPTWNCKTLNIRDTVSHDTRICTYKDMHYLVIVYCVTMQITERYGFRVHSAPFRDATPAELDDMVGRWCKPTVASQGGAPLLSKNYDYYVPKPSPTCHEVRGLDQMFRGNKKMTQEQLSASIARLNTPHKRFQNPTKCR